MDRVSRVLVLKQIKQKMINLAVSPHSPRNATLAATKQESSDPESSELRSSKVNMQGQSCEPDDGPFIARLFTNIM